MKKRLLAGLLSFTMLTAEVLPVIAADDAVVSENVVVEEDAAEEEAEFKEADLTEEEQAIFDSLEPGESYEVFDGENTITYSIEPVELVKADVQDQAVPEVGEEEEFQYAATTFSYIYARNEKTATLNAGTYEVNGSVYNVNAAIAYYSNISYRAKKIKPEKLNIHVTKSGLYDIASALAIPGTYSSDVIKWKFTMKNNKTVNYKANPKKDGYFTVKASVNTKIAKQMGIKGKTLTKLKKAVKQFNKVAKTVECRIPYTIDPVNVDVVFSDPDQFLFGDLIITYQNSWGLTWTENKGRQFRIRMDEDQPYSITGKTYKKWTKPASSDIKIKKGNVVAPNGRTYKYTVTPQFKNFVGSLWYFN